ncbi:MAG: TrmH family RNA methyltransferase [Symbiobacteriaceae bacterium]|nr:TrmH family RNA methyltransferase [Symbiobacteriaceae bacterium]
MPIWKSYRKEGTHSYSLGAFPTIELLQRRPEQVLALLMHPSFANSEAAARVAAIAEAHNIPVQTDAKAFTRISPKENCYLIGVFHKYEAPLEANRSHLLLVNPADRGNLGTIIRTMLGFAVTDLAIITPGVDFWDPQVIRASMGAVFSLNFAYYLAFNEYLSHHPAHLVYPFMLQGKVPLAQVPPPQTPYTLVFGNESSGLDESYRDKGISLVIPHAQTIDSLSLPVAVAIALEHFYRRDLEEDEQVRWPKL